MVKSRTYKQKSLTQLLMVAGFLVTINILSSSIFKRIDLTEDRRYTLSDSTKKILRNLKDVVFVKVYLKGEFPAGFTRLSNATVEILDEFKVYGGEKLQYEFIDPAEDKTETELNDVLRQLAQKGLAPTNVQTKGGDEYSQKIIVPGAIVTYGEKETAVNLLENNPGVGAQSALANSMAHLEYNLSRAIYNLTFPVKPRIGFIRGQGEMDDYRVAGLMDDLSYYYDVQFLELDNLISIPASFKSIMILKPQVTFSEKNKFKIDQYLMNGGTALWMIESLNAEIDSVVKNKSFLTIDYPLNLEDQLFRYGVRINPALLMDLQSNPVPLLVSMEGQKPNFKLFPCFYFPVLAGQPGSIISRSIDAVTSQFCSTIDTLALSGVKKTVLLQSSEHSRIVFTPWMVDFRELRNRPVQSEYNKKNLIAAVLLEGIFPSAFKNRVPADAEKMLRDSLSISFKEISNQTKMIVIADGDIAANEFNSQQQPLPLGLYKFTGEYFSNKSFLLNCMDYLTGYPQLISTRSKQEKLRLLDEPKVKSEKLSWQLLNFLLPLALLLLFGIAFNIIRNWKFTRA